MTPRQAPPWPQPTPGGTFVLVVGILKDGTGKTTSAWFTALYHAVALNLPTLLLDADVTSQSAYDWFKVAQASALETRLLPGLHPRRLRQRPGSRLHPAGREIRRHGSRLSAQRQPSTGILRRRSRRPRFPRHQESTQTASRYSRLPTSGPCEKGQAKWNILGPHLGRRRLDQPGRHSAGHAPDPTFPRRVVPVCMSCNSRRAAASTAHCDRYTAKPQLMTATQRACWGESAPIMRRDPTAARREMPSTHRYVAHQDPDHTRTGSCQRLYHRGSVVLPEELGFF
ncbi:hypothetical protein RKD27_007885 [Streptomyces sp. SAI-126]